MDETVGARHNLNKGAEVHDFADDAVVDLAHLRLFDDPLDDLPRRLCRLGVIAGDQHRAVVGDVELAAGLVLDAADDLAAGADDLTDLVRVDLDGGDPRGVGGEVAARLGEGLLHLPEDVQPPLARLTEGLLEDLAGNAADLDIHLQGGNPVLGAADLEVHVAEVVLHPLDVGEDGELVTLLHQPHGDPRGRFGERHAGVHQRQDAAAHGGHGGGAVRLQDLGEDADHVREGLLGRQQRPDGARRQCPVADLAAARRTEELRLAHGEGGEVVVQQEALVDVAVDGVQPLGVASHPEGGGHQPLGLPTGEDGGTVDARQDAHLAGDRPDLVELAAVGAHPVVDDLLPHHLRLDVVQERLDRVAEVPVGVELGEAFLLHRVERRLALELPLNHVRLGDLGGGEGADVRLHGGKGGVGLHLGQGAGRLAHLLGPLALQLAQAADLIVGEHQGVDHHRLGDLLPTGLHHVDRVVGTGDHQVEVGVLELGA